MLKASNSANPDPKNPVFTNITNPNLNSNKIQSQFQHQEDEDDSDARSIYLGSDDRSATVVVHRPPPEPPDLNSVAVGKGEPTSTLVLATTTLHRSEDVKDAETGVHSGAEDGAVAKGNVDSAKAEQFSHFLEDDDVADLNYSGGAGDGARASAEVSAFVRRKWTFKMAEGEQRQ
ncbi:hypothetical protein PIB30_029946 [Stylosanthes scabra]|uniref:Uncharacterized protein n=1 Tax=Stylosanthes scabra TaxID=79078 RepID=A0ABU6VEH8_9FABA|nr:hypothetical protein [Stylosanthes scabra]